MKLRSIVLFGMGCLLLPLHCGAERSSLATPALNAEDIVDRNVSARGGLEAWRKINAITMTGKLDAGRERHDGGSVAMLSSAGGRKEMKARMRKSALATGEAANGKVIQLPFRLDMQRPGKSRVEVQFKGEAAVQVFDGAKGWKLRPFLGRHEVESFNADETRIASQQQELDGLLVDHAAKGTRVEVAGIEAVEGNPAYKLKLTLRGGDVRNLWVDAKSFLEVKFEGPPRHFDGRMRPVLTYFRDYRTVDGVKLPHVMQTMVDGVKGSELINIETVAINPKFDSGRFAMPN
jgi:hypothetical protein